MSVFARVGRLFRGFVSLFISGVEARSPEVLLQALLLAAILCYWVDHPERRWLTWVMVGAFVVLISFPILGLLATSGVIGGGS